MPGARRKPNNPTPADSQRPSQASHGRFDGRVVVVTGASREGIGGAVAARFGAEGARLVLFSLESSDSLAAELRKKKIEVISARGDVRDQEHVDRSLERIRKRFGRIDVLVNNAGLELGRPFQEMTDSEWMHILDVNLTGVMRITRAALPIMRQPGAVVVNIASALGMVGCPGMTAYSASKGAIISLTQSLGLELAPLGIRVVAVAPGVVRTPLLRRFSAHLTPEMLSQIRATHPLGLGLPHDVASAVAFLASDEARWITGVTLPMGWAPGLTLPLDQVHTELPEVDESSESQTATPTAAGR